MEQVFADIIRTLIDYWMNQEQLGAIINVVAVLELAIQAALMFLWDNRGTTAPLNDE
jgi:hypothetical protein